MEQLRDFSDSRLLGGCVYCGGAVETRDHAPARALLNHPFPDNLPVVGSCWSCNNAASKDEEYFACLIECVLSGTTNPELLPHQSARGVLERSPALRSQLEAARTDVSGNVSFTIEAERVQRVVAKLARGHAAYELSRTCRDAPAYISVVSLSSMTPEQRDEFDSAEPVALLDEIGTRQMQRLLLVAFQPRGEGSPPLQLPFNDWVSVQDGVYRYHASAQEGEVRVRILIREYLACDVRWHHD